MRRKRIIDWCIWAAAAALLLLGYLWFCQIIDWPIPSKADFARIEIGAPRSEVIDILGSPNGRFSDPNVLAWVGSDGQVTIQLDTSGRVSKKEYHEDSGYWMGRIWRRFVPLS